MRGGLILLAVAPWIGAAGVPAPAVPDALAGSHPLTAESAALLGQWYAKVGSPKDGEPYGDLVARVARVQLGKPYQLPPERSGPELLRVDLTHFECLSLVESSLAVARCTWLGSQDQACFLREVEASRYREGRLDGYASRLHYFSDWLGDNFRRSRVSLLTAALGGEARSYRFDYISTHPGRYPALAEPGVRETMVTQEARISGEPLVILAREAVRGVQHQLAAGDLVAVVSDRLPGLGVGHVGFVDKSLPGPPRLLHASSHHRRVIITPYAVGSYFTNRPDRQGAMLARPQPPAIAIAR